MQQYVAETSFTAGIESSNAARFKLISRISRGLQHNVMLLGRRSDLWRLQFSRCQKKSGAKTNEEGGKPIGWIAKTGSSPKMKRKKKKSWVLTFSWQFSTFSHPDTVIPIILNCNSHLFYNKMPTFIFMDSDNILGHWTESELHLWLVSTSPFEVSISDHHVSYLTRRVPIQANTSSRGQTNIAICKEWRHVNTSSKGKQIKVIWLNMVTRFNILSSSKQHITIKLSKT